MTRLNLTVKGSGRSDNGKGAGEDSDDGIMTGEHPEMYVNRRAGPNRGVKVVTIRRSKTAFWRSKSCRDQRLAGERRSL